MRRGTSGSAGNEGQKLIRTCSEILRFMRRCWLVFSSKGFAIEGYQVPGLGRTSCSDNGAVKSFMVFSLLVSTP